MSRLRRYCSISWVWTPTLWNTIRTAPAASSPCGCCPREKLAVLGLVTSKTGRSGKQGRDLKRRIEEATKYVSLEQLCLSPQCGFASTEEGNNLTEQDQWAKLARIVEVANEVWG